jgi:hypothetical protein
MGGLKEGDVLRERFQEGSLLFNKMRNPLGGGKTNHADLVGQIQPETEGFGTDAHVGIARGVFPSIRSSMKISRRILVRSGALPVKWRFASSREGRRGR